MKDYFTSLIYPTTLDEHHSAYLFRAFCEYTANTVGTKAITTKAEAETAYNNLVEWFAILGPQFYSSIEDRDSAAIVVLNKLGILGAEEIVNYFSSWNLHHLHKAGFKVPYTVDLRSYKKAEKEKSKISVRVKKAKTEKKSENKSETSKEDISNISVKEMIKSLRETGVDEPEVKKTRNKRAHFSGITRVRNQHLGIKVVEPVQETEATDDNYFILHGLPGANDKVLAYPCEEGKTIADYIHKNQPSWANPYLLAIRHDYVERTGCPIQDVRKVCISNWNRTFKKLYAKAVVKATKK